MRVFVAGASGAIGQRLVPQLVEAGHQVIGTHHRPERADRLRAMGATPVALDLLDAPRVHRAVLDAKPDAVIHQATALADARLSRNFAKVARQTTRLRSQGTDTLLAAAKDAGVQRFVAQSFAMFRHAPGGRPIKSEDDPVDPAPPAGLREPFSVLGHLEDNVTRAGGLALRYGGFYGAANDGFLEPVVKHKIPLIGAGTGVACFIHLDDAAAATVLALEHGAPGVYNIVDDEPAPMKDWLPAMAAALGAKPPGRAPLWLARLLGGDLVVAMNRAQALSNAKAKRELGWTLKYPSWRQGFAAVYSKDGTARPAAP